MSVENLEKIVRSPQDIPPARTPRLKLIRGTENGRSLLEHAIVLFSDAYLDEVGSGSELTNSSWCVRLLHLIDDLLASEHDEYADILQLGNRLTFLYCEGSYMLAAQKAKDFLAKRYGVQFDRQNSLGPRVPMPLSPVPLINAALSGVLIGIAEYWVTEVSSSGSFYESELLLESCRPVTLESPSTVERMMLAGRNRILGKILKDQGKWEDATRCFELFCINCLLPGTYFEGWATADWGQVLMELGRYEEAEAVIQRLLREREENVHFQTERKLADRQDDTILLQINLAESKLQQGFLPDAESRIEDMLEIILGLGSLSHYEKTRVYSMYTSLARVSHIQKCWSEAKLRWQKALDYGQTIAPSGVPWGAGSLLHPGSGLFTC